MRSEMEPLLSKVLHNCVFDSPVFLDSEDLSNLNELQAHVARSCAVVLLLTKNTLSRPWILAELVTAHQRNLRIVPVEIRRVGNSFRYPDDDYYQKLRTPGQCLDESGVDVLHSMGISLLDVEAAVKSTFMQIAMVYSPHRNAPFRQAELEFIIKQCAYVVEEVQ